MAQDVLFQTQRTKVIAAYQAAAQPFNANTKPYKSSVAFNLVVTGVATVGGQVTGGWAIARAGQKLEWFSYGLGNPVPGVPQVPIPAGSGAFTVAQEDDTNLSKARSTNGAEDFVIESISATCRSVRVLWAPADVTAGSATAVTIGVSDPDVVAALNGFVPVLDPGSLYESPQISSPFNLEQSLMSLLAPHIAVEFEWDRQRVEKIGTLDQIPEGGAKSMLRASGMPSTSDRYRVPEGYLWRRDGQPDCEFIVRGTLQRSVAIPLSPTIFPNVVTTQRLPTQIGLDIVMRLHGLSVKIPSRN